ncbi:hypothetical protein RI054_32g127440 [Pseudoscourfieldia marina]
MTDCKFRGNRAGGHGGAVYATDSVEVRATDVLFYDNEGGALAPPESCAIKISGFKITFSEEKNQDLGNLSQYSVGCNQFSGT